MTSKSRLQWHAWGRVQGGWELRLAGGSTCVRYKAPGNIRIYILGVHNLIREFSRDYIL